MIRCVDKCGWLASCGVACRPSSRHLCPILLPVPSHFPDMPCLFLCLCSASGCVPLCPSQLLPVTQDTTTDTSRKKRRKKGRKKKRRGGRRQHDHEDATGLLAPLLFNNNDSSAAAVTSSSPRPLHGRDHHDHSGSDGSRNRGERERDLPEDALPLYAEMSASSLRDRSKQHPQDQRGSAPVERVDSPPQMTPYERAAARRRGQHQQQQQQQQPSRRQQREGVASSSSPSASRSPEGHRQRQQPRASASTPLQQPYQPHQPHQQHQQQQQRGGTGGLGTGYGTRAPRTTDTNNTARTLSPPTTQYGSSPMSPVGSMTRSPRVRVSSRVSAASPPLSPVGSMTRSPRVRVSSRVSQTASPPPSPGMDRGTRPVMGGAATSPRSIGSGQQGGRRRVSMDSEPETPFSYEDFDQQ